MSSLEKMLLENMMRFGPKNLTEWDRRKLQQLLKEQDPATPTTATPTTNRQGVVTPSTSAYEEITIAPADWGITGFTPPTVRSSAEFKAQAGSTLTPQASAWVTSYMTYLDAATGYIGKTLLVFKDTSLDTRNIVERIQVASSFSTSFQTKGKVYIWSSAQTRNYDKTNNTMIVAANAVPDPMYSAGDISGYEIEGETGLVKATLMLVPDRRLYGGSSLPTVANVTFSKEGNLPLTIKNQEYVINSANQVYKKGVLIGYTPANAVYSMNVDKNGFGFTTATGKAVPIQEVDPWYDQYAAAEQKAAKKR